MPQDLRAMSQAAADALLRATGAGARKLLPHQIPPREKFMGWLLAAGRGSGKTEACAHYVVDHVNGPPCISGPVPHWIGIIAPTLGDGVTSCFTGPSGIRSVDPGARLDAPDEVLSAIEKYLSDATNFPVARLLRPNAQNTMTRLTGGAGGVSIKWANGSEAKLFGASSPEDVERLRAGSNRCIAAGTLIRTARGQVPIEGVRIDDYVWTRNGLRRVLATWNNGLREVQKYDHVAGSTWMTPDHEVWTDKGWKQAQLIQPTDTVSTWQTTSTTTVSAGTDVRTMSTTETLKTDSFIAGCGPEKSDQYHQECKSTTRIMINEIIESKISSYSTLVDTGMSMVKSVEQTGTVKEDKQLKLNKNIEHLLVNDVVINSSHEPCVKMSDIVQMPVVTMAHAHASNGCALCAVLSSPVRLDIQPVPVRESALRLTSHKSSVTEVFDLTVEHDHEFFANDLLVSNCLYWLEEMAAWRYIDDCWDHMRFGLRQGPNPHWICSTTPKPRPLIRKLMLGQIPNVVMTKATMYDNPHIQESLKEVLEEAYGGRRLGRQELYAELVDEDENALWTRAMIDDYRIRPEDVPDLNHITVGVDPSGGAGEQGIVVNGAWFRSEIVNGKIKRIGDGYTLADYTCHLSPDGWGKRAVNAAVEWEADTIAVETNYGGQMALSVIRGAAEALGVSIPIKVMTASRGKRVRAEPVAALAQRGRLHHAGTFPELEDQQCTWTEDAGYSPDRLDADVWGVTHLKLVGRPLSVVGSLPSQMATTRIDR